MLQKIRIKLKSYDHATLDQSASDIVRTARRTGAIGAQVRHRRAFPLQS